MKDLKEFIQEKYLIGKDTKLEKDSKYNQSDEDFLITQISWYLDGGGSLKIEDDKIIVSVKKEWKYEIIKLCKEKGFEIIRAGREGKGWSIIKIKRDPKKQEKKYNLNLEDDEEY